MYPPEQSTDIVSKTKQLANFSMVWGKWLVCLFLFVHHMFPKKKKIHFFSVPLLRHKVLFLIHSQVNLHTKPTPHFTRSATSHHQANAVPPPYDGAQPRDCACADAAAPHCLSSSMSAFNYKGCTLVNPRTDAQIQRQPTQQHKANQLTQATN